MMRPTCNWPLKNKVEIQNFISFSCCFYEVPLHTQGKKVASVYLFLKRKENQDGIKIKTISRNFFAKCVFVSLNLIYFIKYKWFFSFLCTSSEVGSCELADYGAGEIRQ